MVTKTKKREKRENRIYTCACGFRIIGDSEGFGRHLRQMGKLEKGVHKSLRTHLDGHRTPQALPQTQVPIQPDPQPQPQVPAQSVPDESPVHEEASATPTVGFSRALSLSVVADTYYQAALAAGFTGTMADFILQCIVGYHRDRGYVLRLVEEEDV